MFLALRRFLIIALALFGSASALLAWTPNAQETELANLLIRAAGQRRPFMTADPILSQVARERAADLARRNYFDHINPDGHGANYLVRQVGYVLPADYPGDGNNLESLSGGFTSASAAWEDWMDSPDHKRHLLGELSFFAAQTAYGVGYYADPNSEYRHYWVVLTAPAMPVQTAITITSPTAGAPVAEGALAVAGTTSGKTAASRVQARFEHVDGHTPWRTLAGTKSWSGTLEGATPGANTLRVRMLAAEGTVLAQATRSFQFIVLRPLTIHVRGEGSVGAFEGATARQLTHVYRLTATPAEGWVFAGWSGSWDGANARVSVKMREGLEATATFVPNPFSAVRGAYRGLVGAPDAGHGERGWIEMRVNGLGRFTGRLLFAGKNYPLLGELTVAGNALLSLPSEDGAPLRVQLALDLTRARLAGTVGDGDLSAAFDFARAAARGEIVSAFAGRYTLALLKDAGAIDPDAPRGIGCASLVVDETGRATFTGSLADGTALSRTGTIAANGTLSFYAPIYAGGGSLTGLLTFSDQSSSDLAGTLRWSKPRTPAPSVHRPAFATALAATGSLYETPAPSQPVLAIAARRENVTLLLSGGNLDADIAQPATLDADHTVAISGPALPALSVTINALNGRMRGSFVHPRTGAAAPIRGVILQKQNIGAGYFLGVNQSGRATLAPAP